MKQANNFKKSEKKFLIFLIHFFSRIKIFISSIVGFLVKAGKQKVTIMLIPHSEKKVFNFRINMFALFMFLFISSGIIFGIFVLTNIYFKTIKSWNETNSNVALYEKRSRDYQELLNEIIETHSIFQDKLNILLSHLDSDVIKIMQESNVKNANQGGPLNLVDSNHISEFDMEKGMVKDLLNDYQYSIQAFSEINKLSYHYQKLLKDLPFGSPVQGPYAITSGFGLRVHPLTKSLDFHQGIDLAYQAGTPIVATAPGIVEKVEWSPGGYGWYCKLSHKLGFSTLYAHMRSRPVVNVGDKIQKGSLLGYMGATGLTTGTHCHYEIHLGDNLLDPFKFVVIY